jgi:hypothetical protein
MQINKFWLSAKDVEELTGAKARSKQQRVLDFMGYGYNIRPDGSFVVPIEQFLEAKQKEYKMDFSALG